MKPIAQTMERFAAVKEQVAKLQRLHDQADGALKQTAKQIKDEFGCGSLKEARAKLVQLEQAEEAARNSFNEAVDAFETQHKEAIELYEQSQAE